MIAFRKHSWEHYKYLVCECSNLKCHHYTQLEAHHIIPIAAGGLDEFDNIIILCKTCHMNNGYHTDWMLHQDELHRLKDEVDSHLVNELQQKQLIDSDCYYTENYNISKVDIKEENTTNEDFIYKIDEELLRIGDTGEMRKCWNCHKRKISFKFKNGIYCIECINKFNHSSQLNEFDHSLQVTEFVFEVKIFPNLFREYNPIKCEINRKERERRMVEVIQ